VDASSDEHLGYHKDASLPDFGLDNELTQPMACIWSFQRSLDAYRIDGEQLRFRIRGNSAIRHLILDLSLLALPVPALRKTCDIPVRGPAYYELLR
jgi:hypothetical protein